MSSEHRYIVVYQFVHSFRLLLLQLQNEDELTQTINISVSHSAAFRFTRHFNRATKAKHAAFATRMSVNPSVCHTRN